MNPYPILVDDTLRETMQHGTSSYPFAYYPDDLTQFDFHCIDWHWHHELELIVVAEGTAICRVGNENIEVPQGHGLFINSGILHRFECEEQAFMPNIVFSPQLLAAKDNLIYEKYIQPVLQSALTRQYLDPQVDWQKQVLGILAQIFHLQEQHDKEELQTLQLLLQLWEILFRHLDRTSGTADRQRLNHTQAKLQKMMQYIHEHFPEDLTLADIASSASISKNRAIQIFQDGIQIPPISYLIQYRLSKAADLLYTTTKPVSTIAAETGFTSAGYFCRCFKKRYQISPMEYRKRSL